MGVIEVSKYPENRLKGKGNIILIKQANIIVLDLFQEIYDANHL